MDNSPNRVLVLDMDNPIARHISLRLLKAGYSVVATGTSEKNLGTLKSFESFTFYRLDISVKPIIRSYIYGIGTIIFFDRSSKILQKIDNLYNSIMHLKSAIPRLIFISDSRVFQWKPDKIWSEQDAICPDTEIGNLFCGVETIINNYATTLQNSTCIIRIPRVVDQILIDEGFLKLIDLLERNFRIDYESSRNISVQLVNLDYLMEVIHKLFETSWDGIEIFHVASLTQKFLHLLENMKAPLDSKSYIIKDNVILRAVNTVLTISPLVQKKWALTRQVGSVEFLQQPILDTNYFNSMYALKELDIRRFLKSFPRKYNQSAKDILV